MEEVEHGLADVPLLEDLATVLVDLVPLVVQHVVELESAFADVEVAAFNLDLRLSARPGHRARVKVEGRTFNIRKRGLDRKSTRLNSRHFGISYAVFCLTKKKTRT